MKEVIFKLPDEVLNKIIRKVENTPQEASLLEKWIYDGEERKTGKWFDNANKYDKRAQKHDYFCLECKTHAMDFICGSEDWWCGKPPKYCPNCGAKMEVDEC